MTDLARDAFIDGRWVTGARFAVRDPFDDSVITEVTDCTDADVDAAIAAAARAFVTWRAQPGPARGVLLRKLGERMLADEDRLAKLCVRENGKPMKEAVAEVRYAASFLSWFAGEAERTYGEIIPAGDATKRILVTREPVGPCAVITPWNFPYAMLARKLGAALAAGCTVVAKPAAQTPLGTLAMAQLGAAVGLPAGVFNVVTGTRAGEIGARLIASSAIRKLSFTGSTGVGRDLAKACAPDLKRVSLELGGNAPFVVLADADVDAAVEGALVAKFRNTGQSCVAANRFIVEQPVADAFTSKLVAAVAKLKTGRGDGAVDIGPLIDDKASSKVAKLVADALSKGATLAHGTAPTGKPGPVHRLIAPVVLTGITPEMDMWREEIFGPVVAIRVAADEAEALAQANDTEYGLVAYLYTRDGARQAKFADGLQTGMVGINDGMVSTAQAPFGGIKQSGYGREGSHHGIEDYTQLKYVAQKVG